MTEGDVNISEVRKEWNQQITDPLTRQILKDDARYFLHQSMSSPCLDVLDHCKGSGMQTISGRYLLDFHRNNVHQLGYGNDYVIEQITRQMFAFENFGIEPDILCLGKGLGGGIIPFAAMIARDHYNVASDISLGHYTHEKSPLGSVAALASIEYIENNNLLQKAAEDGLWMQKRLNRLKEKYPLIGDIRGQGLLWGIELVKYPITKEKATEEAGKIMYDCMRNGLNFKVSQGNVLQLSPALTISREDLQTALCILSVVFDKYS